MGSLTTKSISEEYVQAVVDRPALQHAAVRLGLMLAGIAERTGGFPVVMMNKNFITGYDRDGVQVPGVQFRAETVKSAIASLQEEGLLKVEEADFTVRNHRPQLYTLTLG